MKQTEWLGKEKTENTSGKEHFAAACLLFMMNRRIAHISEKWRNFRYLVPDNVSQRRLVRDVI